MVFRAYQDRVVLVADRAWADRSATREATTSPSTVSRSSYRTVRLAPSYSGTATRCCTLWAMRERMDRTWARPARVCGDSQRCRLCSATSTTPVIWPVAPTIRTGNVKSKSIKRFNLNQLWINLNFLSHTIIRLSTDAEMPKDMKAIKSDEIKRFISRCAVCESASPILAVHSQSVEVPECPYGWEGMWIGCSYWMNTDAGAQGSGQPLHSPGSCLPEFMPNPYIECIGRGQCNTYSTAYSFWLSVIESSDQFRTPEPMVLKSGDLMNKVSRCQACKRRKQIIVRSFKKRK